MMRVNGSGSGVGELKVEEILLTIVAFEFTELVTCDDDSRKMQGSGAL